MRANKSRRPVEQQGSSTSAHPSESIHNGQVSQADSASTKSSRLVFGLSSRTNKLKHDEYAEKRITQQRLDECSPRKGSGEKIEKVAKKIDIATILDGPERRIVDAKAVPPSSTGELRKKRVAKPKCNKQIEPNEARQDDKLPFQVEGPRVIAVKSQVASQAQPTEIRNKRMQFHVPPPPQQVTIPTTGKGSVVSYAKSRIYDKHGKSASTHMGQSLLETGKIPDAILSGFKPPKQVNVSKARERWEGGEPFAKCKSRQRLAAQAGKKLLDASWSMNSVVATQQLQLQQALANFSAPIRSNPEKSDPPVKVLTRGSVLERVQQFERVPRLASGSIDVPDDLEPERDYDQTQVKEVSVDTSSVKSSPDLKSGASKQANYKNKVTSIQINSATPSDPLANIISSPTSPTSPLRRSSLTPMRRRNSSSSGIPRFYHPNGKPNTYELELQKRNIVACFDKLPDRKAVVTGPMCRRHFHSIALACGFSEYFKEPLCLYVRYQLTQSNLLHNQGQKQSGGGVIQSSINSTAQMGTSEGGNKMKPLARAASIDTSTMEKLQNQTYVTCDQFLICWRNIITSCYDNPSRFIHLLTLGKRNYLVQDDFIPLIQSIIDDHPGLKFLRAAPDFHLRYIQTVIARIFFSVNKSWTGKINSNELRSSNFLAVLQVLSQEEDINQITDYFSYEHFYVIYCKFWSLDQDHDLFISKEDLAKHNDAAISSRIIDRIFMGIVSCQIQKTGKMSYSDFVWFLIAEEDKKHPRSIEYWFRLMDIDGDGYISMYEMEYFYFEQMKRLEMMNIEALPFQDCACQILDLVNPRVANKISLSDLKRTRMATIFFDTFINLEKYLEHESREFVSTRDTVQDGVVISDWDRYAQEEYESLVIEESAI